MLQYIPVGTFVIPGKSTKVRFKTWGENIFRLIEIFEIPLFFPENRKKNGENKNVKM